MADEPSGVFGYFDVTKKFFAMVIDILITSVVLRQSIEYLTCSFVFYDPSKDLGPKILKERWKSSIPQTTGYHTVVEHLTLSVEENMSQRPGPVLDFAIPDSFLLGSIIRVLVPQTLVHPNSLGQIVLPSTIGAELFWCQTRIDAWIPRIYQIVVSWFIVMDKELIVRACVPVVPESQ